MAQAAPMGFLCVNAQTYRTWPVRIIENEYMCKGWDDTEPPATSEEFFGLRLHRWNKFRNGYNGANQ